MERVFISSEEMFWKDGREGRAAALLLDPLLLDDVQPRKRVQAVRSKDGTAFQRTRENQRTHHGMKGSGDRMGKR